MYTFVCFILIINIYFVVTDNEDRGSSLVFVFDTTGSMYNDLKQLREGAELILDTALKSENNVIDNFVFVPFHDPGVGPATVTRDKEEFKSVLNIVNVYGGGDCREMSLGGIKLALNVSLPKSYIYVFTDATAQDHHLINNVLDLVQRKQTQVVFILTGHCNDLDKPSFQVYQQIAAASSGQLFNLNKTSVYKVLEFVRSSITGRTVNLDSVVNSAGTNYTQKIPVDSTVGEVTVSVSGSRPHIKVVNPLGEHIKGPPKLVTTLDLSEIMVVKVMQPESGNWTINVGSDVDYSVKVVGLSNLTFQHGFSTQRPNSMRETTYRPLKGADNYMIITLTEINVPIKITYAEILTLDGKKLFELPLKKNLKGSYLADAFVPPDGFFYIAINGYDENNQELRRIGATAIQAKLPEAPILTVSSEIDIGIQDDGTLSCYVESLVPFTAQWYKGNRRLQKQVSSLTSSYVDYTIENMSEDKEGAYRCIAKNVAGVSASTTKVNIISNPPQITMNANITTLSINDVVTISCVVYSEGKVIHAELQFNGLHRKNVVNITNFVNSNGYYNKTITASKEDDGIYTCIAVNKAGESKETTKLKVIDHPKAKLNKSIEIPTKLFSRIQIQCQIENANNAQIVSPNGTILITEEIMDLSEHEVVLDVNNTTLEHSGLWTCKAKRNEHVAIDSVLVTIVMNPIVKIEGSKNIVLEFGTNKTITCVVTGHPAPKITWFNSSLHDQHMKVVQKSLPKPWYGSRVPSGRPSLTRLADGISVEASSAAGVEYISELRFVNINETSEQIYYCIANNSDIRISDSVTVNVKKIITVLQRPEDKSVDLYDDTKLYCKVDSYPESKIIWYHNNTEVISNNKLNISAENSTITIKNVDFTYTGVYCCKISNKYETIVLSSTINVQNFEAPELLKRLTQISIGQGSAVHITCRYLKGKPIPQLTWFYVNENTNETLNLPKDVIVNSNDNLFIPKVNLEHDGIYKCRAKNIIGEDTYDLKLVVLYAPRLKEINHREQNIETKAGSKIVLECNVYSVPSPLIVWSKNNKTIAYSKNIYVNEKSNLIIDVTTEHDSGIYVCTASNKYGSVQRNFTLFVYVPPDISNTLLDPNVEVLEGQMVALPCTPVGYPKPNVHWLHNGNTVEETLKKQIDNEFTLRFVSNLTDFGEYTCTAMNKFGNMSYTYTVLVWVPPTIDLPSNTIQDITIGADVHIQCNAMGFPVPTILWEYEDEIFTINTTKISFNDIGSLYIRNVSTDNKGVYVCIAENVAGFSKKYVLLNVYEPPSIIDENYSSPYIASNKELLISIPCRATGNPKPTIVWTKDNTSFATDSRYSTELDGTLTITRLSEELSGNFTCTATNKYGTANKTISVQIYSIPEPIQSDEPTNNVMFVENTNVNLTCPFKTSQNDILRWYKDGRLISTGPKVFKNISRNDEGTYACTITNPIGAASMTIQLLVEWPPHFINENYTKSLEIIKGDDCYFDCEVDAKPSAQIKWLHESKVLQSENNKLKIMNAKLGRSGRYSCVVTNIHGVVSRNFNLEVLEPPFISEFDLLDIKIKEGTNATLQCEVKGIPKPTVLWTYNNTNWRLYNNSLMSIHSSKESEGLFRCDARSKAGSTYIVYRVAVVTPATIKNLIMHLNGGSYEVGKEIEVKKGSNIKISCEANGDPIPSVKWIRNGKILMENQLQLAYSDFILHEIDISDSGRYMCSVANEIGMDERTINIEILEPPTIYKSLLELKNTSEKSLEMNIIYGQTYYLHCHPYGNPVPQVYWFKDDVPLRLFDQTMYSTEFGEVLVSNSAHDEQSGNYTCVARNKVGQSSISYLVNVLVPPTQPKSNVKRFRSLVGNSIKLHCPNDGRPLPQVTWVKHPYIRITEEYDSRMEISENNYTLVIKYIDVKDGGNYSCILTNVAGTMEMVYELVVEKPAKIISNVNNSYIENILVPMQRSVILKCQLDGYPQPKLTWIKDMVGLRSNLSNLYQAVDESLLIIWNAQADDAGQYICVAENTAGTDHRRFNVNVKVPGKWSVWSQWSLCNVSCGLGYQHRDRSCQYVDDDILIDKSPNIKHPYLVLDDTVCKGSSADIRKCHMPSCEDDNTEPHWLSWSKWSQCSSTCGVGSQTRTRRCKPKDARCSGDNIQIKKCESLSPCTREILESDNYDINNPYEPESTYVLEPEEINSELEDLDIETGPKYTVKPVPRSDYFYVNVTENLDHSVYEPCKPGFKYNDSTQECQDIDECLIDTNNCHATQLCTNTAGGYGCSCQRGYIAFGAGQRCLDVNECSQNIHGCEFACVNTAGGYVCACPQHLRLHTDRRTCIDVRRRHSSNEDTEDILSANMDFSNKFTKKYRN